MCLVRRRVIQSIPLNSHNGSSFFEIARTRVVGDYVKRAWQSAAAHELHVGVERLWSAH
jgi:hypothetical protein